MRCSVIVPCHGRSDLTRACVRSLLDQDGGWDLEILLVDNASPDDTPELGALHPAIRVLRQARNLGFAGGANQGLDAASHPLLLLCNNDTRAAPDLLPRLHQVLARDATVGFVAPVSNHVKGPARIPVGNAGSSDAGMLRIVARLRQEFSGMVQDVDNLSGLCLMFRRSTIERIGPLDERFGPGCYEDDDLSLRARLHGLRLLIVRDAFLHHEGHATFQALGLRLDEEMSRQRARFEARWQDDPAGAAWLALQRGDLPGAADAALAARRLHPLWPDADWILGCHHANRGEAQAAVGHLRAFLRACPEHPGAAVRLATLLAMLGRSRESKAVLHHALQACPVSSAEVAAMEQSLGLALRARGRQAVAAGSRVPAAAQP